MTPRKAVKKPNLPARGKPGARSRNRYAEALAPPKKWRGILGGFILVLVIRVFCSDPLGNLRVPALRQCFYLLPIALAALFLIYIDLIKKARRPANGRVRVGH